MARTVDALIALTGFSYVGLDAGSLEPLFRSDDGNVTPFDALPTRARHLVAFAALSVRALWGAYPMRDPMETEAVIAIDEIELQQDSAVLGSLLDCLRNALPRVQWIVTTTSPVVAASAGEREVFALRKLPRAHEVQLFSGAEARVH
jgi:predicted ATP-binding protein involved in virulence